MNYFNPADLIKIEATFNYVAKSGVGFGILPNNEQVFIPARIVDQKNLSIGDALVVWAVDNYASKETEHFASRWRAVRVEVSTRVEDIVSHETNTFRHHDMKPVLSDLSGHVVKALEDPRPWTPNEMAHALRKENALLDSLTDLPQRVGACLIGLHNNGQIARLEVNGKPGQAHAVYYAKNVQIFYDHLDSPLAEE